MAISVGLSIVIVPALGAPGPLPGSAVTVRVCQLVPFTVRSRELTASSR
jgi:hypothetical protein